MSGLGIHPRLWHSHDELLVFPHPLELPMNRNPLFQLAATVYGWIVTVATWLQPVFLLVIRLYWGWQFFVTGKGKLMDIPKVTGFFQSFCIPFPCLNAYLAGFTECF